MQVVHITSAHPRDDVRILLKECASLARAGHGVTLLVADGKGNQKIGEVQVLDVGRPAGRIHRILMTPRRLLKLANTLQAGVFHLHDPELLTIALRLKKRGARVFFDSHEDVPRQILAKHYLRPWARSMLSRLVASYERYVCSRLSGVVAATPTIRSKFASYVRHVVDVNNFPLLGELDGVEDDGRGGNEICYIGGIAVIRGVREMVQAMGHVVYPGACLNLVGTFIEPAVEEELKSTSQWRKVHSWGQQDRAGVRSVLGRSSIGLVTLHPTLNYLDALPVKMFEYMAAGVPVIASDFPLWRQIVDSVGCGVCVDPLDPQAIARAIDSLLADPERARQMGLRGRQAVLERFNWGVEEKKLLDFYRSLS